MPAAKTAPPDWIQQTVAARAAEQGLTAYALARRCDGAVSEDTLSNYLRGRASLTSGRLAAVLRVLGLTIAPAAAPEKYPHKSG